MTDDAKPGESEAHEDPMIARLAALASRLERVILAPEKVRSRFDWLARPLLRSLKWRPKFSTAELTRLLDLMAALEALVSSAALDEQLERAVTELGVNVRAAERGCVVHGKLPVGYDGWLERLYDVVAGAARVLRADRAPEGDAKNADTQARALPEQARRELASVARVRILAPLRRAEAGAPVANANLTAGNASAPSTPSAPSAPRAMPPATERAEDLEALQLSAVDHLLDAARGEHELLSHRRKLLEAARAVLLETSAALPLEAAGTHERLRHIASEIVRIDRLEAAGLRADVGILHQARSALAAGDRNRLYTALVALDGAALESGDGRAHGLLSSALSNLERRGPKPAEGDASAASLESLEGSYRDVLGDDVLEAVREARRAGRQAIANAPVPADPQLAEMHALAKVFVDPVHDDVILPLALATDGCFEVGGTLSPTRVEELTTRLRAVTYPTQRMLLLPARGIEDVPSAVIEDPRTIVLSMAAGRLLTRRYVREEVVKRERIVLRGEVRVYVLDGSTSMMEADPSAARARMRDAILLAELATLMRRYDEATAPVRVVLYFRYFTRNVGPIRKVASSRDALEAIGEVLSTVRNGGTDIEAALRTSFAQVRETRAQDPDLGRAQIVLVTDGDAPVRPELIEENRQGLEGLPIQLSVIALGEENPALRAIVAKQREQGERAFYHFVPDAELVRLARGDVGRDRRVHLDPRGRAKVRRGGAGAGDGGDDGDAPRPIPKQAELEAMLDDLAALKREEERGGAALRLELESGALDEAALGKAGARRALALRHGHEGAAARREAFDRDRRALERRFDRAFPPPPSAKPASATSAVVLGHADDDEGAVLVILATIAETLSVVGGSDIVRQADAIDLLERLLPDAGLRAARYAELTAAPSARLADALDAVRTAAGFEPA